MTYNLVNSPKHYAGEKLHAIDVIEDFKLNFHLGNAVKYIIRSKKKGDKVENLRKAIWYLEREIYNNGGVVPCVSAVAETASCATQKCQE